MDKRAFPPGEVIEVRYEIAAVIALLIVALGVCSYLSHKSAKKIGRRVMWLNASLMLPVTGNLIIILSSDKALSTFGHFVYFLGMNVVMVALIRFTLSYCLLPENGRGVWRTVQGLLVADAIQLLLNPLFHHAFETEAVEVAGAAYYRLVPHFGQAVHRIVCYGIFLAAVAIFLWKLITAPRLYFERYAVIFFSMVAIGIWETFYIFSSSPIDRSMIGFGFFGILVYYFAIHYRPIRLLDKMLANVASEMFRGIFFFDAVGRCIWVNPVGMTFAGIDDGGYDAVPDRLAALFGDIRGDEWTRHEITREGGETRYFYLEKHSVADSRGKTAGTFLSVYDETEQQRALEQERYNAAHDALTGLYSREHLYKCIREMIDGDPDQTYMICYLDISDFKMVNDIFGREFGDYALQQVAESMKHAMEGKGICGRLSGDTFGMCLPRAQFSAEIAEKSLEHFIVARGGAEYRLVIHQGVYEATERGMDVSVMFDRASLALDSIKDEYNVHLAFYDDVMRERVLWNQKISDELEQAIAQGQIRPYLQAIVDDEGRAVGAEALVRWIHPREGFLAPYRFVPVFEQNGMIAQVDRHMWRCACEILSGWRDNDLFISINVSPKDFYFMDVVEELTGLAEEYGVEPSRLRVEITETVMMSDETKRISILKALQARGFIVEMDDFGSGYSSLNMLKDMPVDLIKIDMVFLRKAEDDERAQMILDTIIGLTGRLRIPSLSEGVETEAQFQSLKRMGCKLFQGYYFAKPMPVEAFEEYLAGREARA